jgi:hypothetical protein
VRALIAIALIAALGAAGLGYAWHVLGKLPPPAPAVSATAPEPPDAGPRPTRELERVELRDEPAATPEDPARSRAPDGLEEGGGLPIVRDYAAIYADRTPDERRAAAERLLREIEAARAALGPAERAELAGRRGNAVTTPGVARLLALLEERAWLVAQLAGPPPAQDGR